MNSKLLKRLFRAIGSGSEQGLDQLARVIVEDERQKGHTRLADELQAILDESAKTTPPRAGSTPKALRELPASRRFKDVMATMMPHDELEHHMVLAKEIELRFQRIEKEYAARERLGVYGLQPKKKILLYGPPGCGKTLGAKCLAWNTGLNVMKVRFDAMISSLFGETASRVSREEVVGTSVPDELVGLRIAVRHRRLDEGPSEEADLGGGVGVRVVERERAPRCVWLRDGDQVAPDVRVVDDRFPMIDLLSPRLQREAADARDAAFHLRRQEGLARQHDALVYDLGTTLELERVEDDVEASLRSARFSAIDGGCGTWITG